MKINIKGVLFGVWDRHEDEKPQNNENEKNKNIPNECKQKDGRVIA